MVTSFQRICQLQDCLKRNRRGGKNCKAEKKRGGKKRSRYGELNSGLPLKIELQGRKSIRIVLS